MSDIQFPAGSIILGEINLIPNSENQVAVLGESYNSGVSLYVANNSPFTTALIEITVLPTTNVNVGYGPLYSETLFLEPQQVLILSNIFNPQNTSIDVTIDNTNNSVAYVVYNPLFTGSEVNSLSTLPINALVNETTTSPSASGTSSNYGTLQQYVTTTIGNLTTDVSNLSTIITDNFSQLLDAESFQTELDSLNSEVQNALSSITTSVDELSDYVESTVPLITTFIDVTAPDISSRLDLLGNQVLAYYQTFTTEINAFNNNITNINNNIAVIDSNIDTISSELMSNSQTNSASVASIEANINFISSQVDNNLNTTNNSITNIQANIDTISSEIDTIDSVTQQLSSDIESNNSLIQNVSASLENQIQSLTSPVSSQQNNTIDDINLLTNNVNTLFNELNSLENTIYADLSVNRSDIVNISSSNLALSSVSNNLSSSTIALSSDINYISGSLTNGTLIPTFEFIGRQADKSSQNWLPNSSFLYGLLMWNTSSSPVPTTDTKFTSLTYQSTDTSLQKVQSDPITANWINGTQQVFTLSAQISSKVTSSTPTIDVLCYDSNNNLLGSAATIEAAIGQDYTKYSITSNLLNNTYSVVIELSFSGDSNTSYVGFSEIKFEFNDVSTQWSDESSSIIINKLYSQVFGTSSQVFVSR
jgi:peptidoglycan hydrolase CwlO-like protein